MPSKRTTGALLATIVVVVVVSLGFFVYTSGTEVHTVGCTVTQYAVWSMLKVNGTITAGTTSTFSGVSSFTTTTRAPGTVGQVVSASTTQATLTGAIAAGNETTCTYLPK